MTKRRTNSLIRIALRWGFALTVVEFLAAMLFYEKPLGSFFEALLFIPLKIEAALFPPATVQSPYLVALSFLFTFILTYAQNALICVGIAKLVRLIRCDAKSKEQGQ